MAIDNEGPLIKKRKTIEEHQQKDIINTSVDKVIEKLQEIKKLESNNTEWLEIELQQMYKLLENIQERIAKNIPAIECILQILVDNCTETTMPLGSMLTLALTSRKIFSINIMERPFQQQKEYSMYKPSKFIGVTQLPVPEFVKQITFHDSFEGQLNERTLPPGVTHLIFQNNSKFLNRIDYLPSSVSHLELGDDFNLVVNKLPPNLSKIFFGPSFNHPISCLPPSLSDITFGYSFNSSPYPLPNNLQILTFGKKFNQPLNNLPNSLTELSFSCSFNQPLQLPPNLSKLNFLLPCKFNHPLHLPSSLKSALFDFKNYSHPLRAEHTKLTSFQLYMEVVPPSFSVSLPNTVTVIVFSSLLLERHASSLLVSSIKELHITDGIINLPPDLPPNITKIYLQNDLPLNRPLGNLPPTLEELIISSYNNPIDHLPSSLTSLIIERGMAHPMDYLPKNLHTLTLGECFTPIDNLPDKLQRLTVTKYFDFIIDNLPQSLTTLIIGDHFNQPINNLPYCLKELAIGNSFNQTVDHLPPSLINLHLGHAFNQSIDKLPSSITHLTLRYAFHQKVKALPSSIEMFACFGYMSCDSSFSFPASLKRLILSKEVELITLLPRHLELLLFVKPEEDDFISIDFTNLAFSTFYEV